MAIPTTNVGVSDVLSELGLAAGSQYGIGTLWDIANADSNFTFNPSYNTGQKSLGDFRGGVLNTVSLTAFQVDDTGDSNSSNGCFGSFANTTMYHNGGTTIPSNGSYVYLDSGGVTAFNGSNLWYFTDSGISDVTLQISTSGQVLSSAVCGGGPGFP